MFFKHIYETGLAQASYLVGCQATGEAIVIDPKRDIDTYLEIAELEKLKITHIAETHIHADFLSGSRELAKATSAEIYLSDEGGNDWQYQFPHIGLKDKDTFKVGNLLFEILHSPGHTPEHISFILTDTASSNHPVMIFTGDFVFVGDVGRPDLLEKAAGIKGTQEIGAHQMFNSLKKFKELPDHIQVWPGHGAGSACGKALGAVPSSTVGYEKLTNWALSIEDENQFVRILLDGQPEPPKYFAMMKKLNKVGPKILGSIPHPGRFSLQQFENAVKENVTIIDTRDKLSFAGGHFPGSINIQDNSSFSTWAGWMLEYDKPFLLVARDSRIEALSRALIRIGLDNIVGYVNDMDKIANAGYQIETINQITVQQLKDRNENFLFLDVRGLAEYNAGHIEDALNIHAGYLKDNIDKLPKDKKIVVHCAGGDRSAIAASFLKRNGYDNIYNLTCGMNGWKQAGLVVVSETADEVLT
ncbi:MAG: rhodanese-like domain-containing protein [Ignavibacterium sp.]|jgi:hydroxyacylglutathione hydrolase|nr:rhodanese-like domain-containing protein [Ignavibacterium sp.]